MKFSFPLFQKRHYFKFSSLIPSFTAIFAGIVSICLITLGIIKPTIPEGIIISLLIILAIDALNERIGAFERIETGIIELLKTKDCKFTTDLQLIWGIAIKMVKNVSSDGHIYDSTSIINRGYYEKTIKEKCKQGTEITRLICSDASPKEFKKFIIFPYDYGFEVPKDIISVRHLNYSLPFDLLITHDGNEMHAIIGFKTSKFVRSKYEAALYIFNKDFASKILSIYQNLLLIESKELKEEGN
jgi:hypothetical protein